MIVIVDYGMGNLGSIKNMIKKIGYDSCVSSKIEDIAAASHIILPGVGSFDHGMSKLSNLNIVDVLEDKVLRERTPVLGICLGMQLMTKRSDEGERAGLGWVDAEVVKFRGEAVKVPHMGWNTVSYVQSSCSSYLGEEEERYYFVHSFYVLCKNKEDVLSLTTHEVEFVSAFQKDNIMGVQFHPEKSHLFGMELFRRFLEC